MSPVLLNRICQQNSMVLDAWAQATRLFTDNPYSPLAYTPVSRWLSAGAEVVHGMTCEYSKPDFGIDHVTTHGKTVDVCIKPIAETPFCNLLHFDRDTHHQDPKMLVVAPMSGHYATLLRDTVQTLLQDHDVYITDWRNARDVPKAHGPYDLSHFMHDVVGAIQRVGPETHVMAVCQPGPAVLASVALMAEDHDRATPRSLVLMGSPMDTRSNPTKVNDFANKHDHAWFRNNVIDVVQSPHAGQGREIYPGHLQLMSFMAMNLDRHTSAQETLFHDIVAGRKDKVERTKSFYREYMAVMDLPAEYYLETIRSVFQECHLPKGSMTVRDRNGSTRPINPLAIAYTAIMTIEGGNDDICGLGQTKAAHSIAANVPDELRSHHTQPDVGHYGLFSNSKWRDEIYPRLRDFVRTQTQLSLQLH